MSTTFAIFVIEFFKEGIKMTFSEKSRELRASYSLTQAELAKAINLSRSCISMIEIGKNEPTASTLIAYSKYFNLSIDYLLDLKDDELKSNNDYILNSYTLSEKEKKHIENLRKLPAETQSYIFGLVENLAVSG